MLEITYVAHRNTGGSPILESGLKSLFCDLLAVYTWISNFISLDVSFLIYKMRIILPSPCWVSEDE